VEKSILPYKSNNYRNKPKLPVESHCRRKFPEELNNYHLTYKKACQQVLYP